MYEAAHLSLCVDVLVVLYSVSMLQKLVALVMQWYLFSLRFVLTHIPSTQL